MLSTLSNRWGTLLTDPFEAVHREFNRDFGFDSNSNGTRPDPVRYGQLSLWENDEQIFLEVDMPGLQIEDLNLTMEKGRLWIRGRRQIPQHNQKRWYDERYYGDFQRVVMLNDTVDPASIDATLRDGVLFITLTKKPEHQPKRVDIKYEEGTQKRLEESKAES